MLITKHHIVPQTFFLVPFPKLDPQSAVIIEEVKQKLHNHLVQNLLPSTSIFNCLYSDKE